MFGHLPELVIVLVLGLIFFGPEKLPEAAAQAGKMIRELRTAMNAAVDDKTVHVPDDDFATYYYDSVARSGEDTEGYRQGLDVPDNDVDYSHTGNGMHGDSWAPIDSANPVAPVTERVDSRTPTNGTSVKRDNARDGGDTA